MHNVLVIRILLRVWLRSVRSFPVVSHSFTWHSAWKLRGCTAWSSTTVRTVWTERHCRTPSPWVEHVLVHVCVRFVCYNFNFSAGGGDGEESGGLPVSSRNPAVAPVYGHGGGLLHCGYDLGVHAHEAQVQLLHGTFRDPLAFSYQHPIKQRCLELNANGRIQTC